MVREDAPRRCPRAGSSSRADSAIEERLPLPFRSEVSQPGKIECTAAGHGGLCDTAQNPAHAGDRGCGCCVADVGAGLGIYVAESRQSGPDSRALRVALVRMGAPMRYIGILESIRITDAHQFRIPSRSR